jgi:zinc protease
MQAMNNSFKFQKKPFALVLLSLLIFLSNPKQSKEMGEFVKDIPLENLEFTFPVIEKTSLPREGELYSLNSNYFPLTELEMYFYIGEEKEFATEVPLILFNVWKLGGTKDLPDSKFLERLEFLGASLSLRSGYEKSSISLSYLNRDEKEVFALMKEWFSNPRITESNLKTIKNQIKESILRRNDSVPGIGMRKSKELFFGSRMQARTEEIASLDAIQVSDLLKYHKKLISAKKVNFALSGSGKASSIQAFAKELLPSNSELTLSSSEGIDLDSWSKEFQSLGKEITLIEKETNQSMVLLLGTMPAHNHPDFYAIQLLNYIIGGGGFNSYFMTEIRNNRGLAYSSSSSISFEKEYGAFYAYTLTKNESVGEVYKLMRHLLSKDTISNIKQSELERAQNAIINQFVFLFQNNAKILSNKLRFDDHNMPKNYLEVYRGNISKVGLADLQRVGDKYFQENLLRTIIVGPKALMKQLPKERFTIKAPEEKIR